MKGHVKIDTVRDWMTLLEDGQADEVYGLMLAELELVGREELGEVLAAQPVAAPETAEVDPELLALADGAKREMKKRGHSYRSAAQAIGKSYPWVCDVLNGKKTSRPVLEAIYSLPLRNPPRVAVKRYPKNVQALADLEGVSK